MVDLASAAWTVAELEIEIVRLTELEQLAYRVRTGGTDRKWEELASLLQNNAAMFDMQGQRRKLVIFTEHRDTLNYLAERKGSSQATYLKRTSGVLQIRCLRQPMPVHRLAPDCRGVFVSGLPEPSTEMRNISTINWVPRFLLQAHLQSYQASAIKANSETRP